MSFIYFYFASFSLFLFSTNFAAIVTKCCTQRNPKEPCISYDSSMLAESIDEAMFTFPNLASNDQATLFKDGENNNESGSTVVSQSISASVMTTKVSIAAVGTGSLFGSSNSECPTQACMSCKMALLNGFLSNPNLGPADKESMTAERNLLALKLGTNEGSCEHSTRKKRGMKMKKRFVIMNTTPGSNDVNYDETTTSSSNSTGKNVLGVVTSLGCQYRRGEALQSDSEWCGLCNLCWQWRKLPSDYYPNYLNEVNCDQNDDGCLSGFGECKPITRPINVMRKKEDDWVKESVEMTTGCECQVEIGSSLHGLVVK